MTRCDICVGDRNCVPGDGPLDADIAGVGEAPGPDENRKGKPFCGKAGREVNQHYLPIAGIPRPKIYITNAIKCQPSWDNGKLDMKKDKNVELLQTCADAHLYNELMSMPNRRLTIAMGAFACRALDPEIDLEFNHGEPLNTAWGKVFPMYHPAGGIHEPKKMLTIRTDWTRLRKYLRGKLVMPIDMYAGKEDYGVINTPDELHEELNGCEEMDLGCDTENKRDGEGYCLTFSTRPGRARLIKAWDPATLKVLQLYLNRWRGRILWHNWVHDEAIVSQPALGCLRFPRKRIVDTMVKIFHLGNQPQGLKVLSHRILGMKMQDFDDVVSPHSRELVVTYYRDMYAEEWNKPEPQLVRDKDGLLKIYQAHSMKTKLKTFFTYLGKNPNKDVFEAWDNWEDSHDMIEAKVGRWPGKCISHVPFEHVVYYANRDADALVRLWPRIKRAVYNVRRKPECDWM